MLRRGSGNREQRASYEHKFAKKPEVIDGNMKALEMAFDAVEALM